MSFPCRATSPIQALNELDEASWLKSVERKKRSRRLVRHGLFILKDYVPEGGHVVWEWPQHNAAWKFPEVIDFRKSIPEYGNLPSPRTILS